MRQTKEIEGIGRDTGKIFLLTEMSAFEIERWASKSLSIASKHVAQGDHTMNTELVEVAKAILLSPQVPELNYPPDVDPKEIKSQMEAAQKQIRDNAQEKHEIKLNSAPTELVSSLGMRLFMELPLEAKEAIFLPLLGCISFKKDKTAYPISTKRKDGEWEITKEAQEYIEEGRTVSLLKYEAFKIHSDFFKAAVPLIFRVAMIQMSAGLLLQEMSPEQSPLSSNQNMPL